MHLSKKYYYYHYFSIIVIIIIGCIISLIGSQNLLHLSWSSGYLSPAEPFTAMRNRKRSKFVSHQQDVGSWSHIEVENPGHRKGR